MNHKSIESCDVCMHHQALTHICDGCQNKSNFTFHGYGKNRCLDCGLQLDCAMRTLRRNDGCEQFVAQTVEQYMKSLDTSNLAFFLERVMPNFGYMDGCIIDCKSQASETCTKTCIEPWLKQPITEHMKVNED